MGINFEIYLTDDRLARLNHLRYRAGVEDVTKERAIVLLRRMSNSDLAEVIDRLG